MVREMGGGVVKVRLWEVVAHEAGGGVAVPTGIA